MVKKIAIITLIGIFCALSFAKYVSGYYRSNGTYVNSYYRSDPDSTVRNNYSYRGNLNPYTGTAGHNYYRHSRTSEYYAGE
jgi:hypothetical protein